MLTANHSITRRLRSLLGCQLRVISYSLIWKNQIVVAINVFTKQNLNCKQQHFTHVHYIVHNKSNKKFFNISSYKSCSPKTVKAARHFRPFLIVKKE